MTPLPYEGENFAAEILLAGDLIGHDALGGGNDGYAESVSDSGKLIASCVDSETGLGHTSETLDNSCFTFAVFEGYSNNALLVFGILHFVGSDITFIKKYLSDSLLKVGCGDVNFFVLC